MIRVTALVVRHLQQKKKSHKQQAQQPHNLLVSILVFIRESYLLCVELWRVGNNIIKRVVKYEYNEYFKLCI